MKRTVCVLQHHPVETLGRIEEALKGEHLGIETVLTFSPQPVPKAMDAYDALVVLGGPMGVYEQDRYPFLRAEIGLIEQALQQNKPILGICLGSQLLAHALGAPVTKGQKEIGWHAVRLSDAAISDRLWAGVPRGFTALHWHGDVFNLPGGAIALAASELTECQAFRYGPAAYGVLFHIEVTQPMIAEMTSHFAEELRDCKLDGEQMLKAGAAWLPNLRHIGTSVFTRWARLVNDGADRT